MPTTHISARMCWHMDGWNGKICQNPKDNVYCTGNHSYPNDVIPHKRNLKIETDYHGCNLNDKKLKGYIPPCSFSINAFGNDTIRASADTPEWYEVQESQEWDMPPKTISIWPYEEMYRDNVKYPDGKFNFDQRMANFRDMTHSIENGKSLIFYYANYSNPFSEDESKRYVIVGVARIKTVHPLIPYSKATKEEQKKYAGAYVWQLPVTSHYPDQGFRAPYHLVKDSSEVLNKILWQPENDRVFKYAMRQVTDDDALSLIERALEIVHYLEFELNDKSENWTAQRKWLEGLISELWVNRGKYPGMTEVLKALELHDFIPYYKKMVSLGKELDGYNEIVSWLNEGKKIEELAIKESEEQEMRRNVLLMDEEHLDIAINLLPRFDLKAEQITKIISNDRLTNNISGSISDILTNPYIISEQYIGDNPDDRIPYSKIDHGLIPALESGLEPMVKKNAATRFRALCVDILKRIENHSFVSAEHVLHEVNKRLSYLPEWKSHQFVMKNFKLDEKVLSEALELRNDESGNLYLYLKRVYEDERLVQQCLEEMASRKAFDLKEFKIPLTEKHWHDLIYFSGSVLAKKAVNEYEQAIQGQIEVCQQIFNKPLSVIIGGAGTGKTHLLDSLIKAIEKVHGAGTPFLLLAPTGKAAVRIREKTKREARTIHSILAEKGWLNDNFTIKSIGGKQESAIKVLIIDECSMIDLHLLAGLFKAISWNTVERIILVGDPNQLPPIGRGKVFAEIIEWLDPSHLGHLKINLRQLENKVSGKGTGILKLASIYVSTYKNRFVDEQDLIEEVSRNSVVKAEITDLLKRIQEGDLTNDLIDLNIKFWKDEDILEQQLIDTLIEDLETQHSKKYNPDKPFELLNNTFLNEEGKKVASRFQIISPYKSERFGTESINLLFQRSLNSYRYEKVELLDGIAIFDKVIQFRNRTKSDPVYGYSKEKAANLPIQLFNGEIGFVNFHGFDFKEDKYGKPYYKSKYFRLKHFKVEFEGKEETVGFGKDLGKYKLKDGKERWIPEQKPIDNLELAYCISVHKSQGSEFKKVYLVLPKNKKSLLSRELLYTAITRASGHLTIFVQEDMGAFFSLLRPETSCIAKINSSLFRFNPLPKEWLIMNDWYEEGKIHHTLSEYMVRSKSEVIIANMLTERGIPFKYEYPLFASDGTFYLPDFTIQYRGREYYLEHVGMLHDEKYMNHWKVKEAWYQKFYPTQLLKTFDNPKLTTDVQQIISDLLNKI